MCCTYCSVHQFVEFLGCRNFFTYQTIFVMVKIAPRGASFRTESFWGWRREERRGGGNVSKTEGERKEVAEKGGLIAQKSCPIKLYPAGGGGGILSHSRRSGGGGWSEGREAPQLFFLQSPPPPPPPLLSLSTTGKRKGEENIETKGAKIPLFFFPLSSHALSFPLFGFHYIALSLPSPPSPSLESNSQERSDFSLAPFCATAKFPGKK